VIVGRHGGARRVPGRRRKRHSVYRFYDGAGGLLYVGLTCDITGRLTKHAGDKDWWVDVARVELEHFGSREVLELPRARKTATSASLIPHVLYRVTG
jgi:hypothetical protein